MLENPVTFSLPDQKQGSVSQPRWNPNLFAQYAPALDASKIPGRNRQYYLELLDFQRSHDEGCFFFGVYGLSAALFPDRPLPNTGVFLKSLRPMYSHLLYRDTLLVRHDRIAQALAIYPEWGIDLRQITLNLQGEQLVGKHLDPHHFPKQVIPKWKELSIENVTCPTNILVHQPGGNNSHYITLDGTAESNMVFEDYHGAGYRTVMWIEPLPLTGNH